MGSKGVDVTALGMALAVVGGMHVSKFKDKSRPVISDRLSGLWDQQTTVPNPKAAPESLRARNGKQSHLGPECSPGVDYLKIN